MYVCMYVVLVLYCIIVHLYLCMYVCITFYMHMFNLYNYNSIIMIHAHINDVYNSFFNVWERIWEKYSMHVHILAYLMGEWLHVSA